MAERINNKLAQNKDGVVLTGIAIPIVNPI